MSSNSTIGSTGCTNCFQFISISSLYIFVFWTMNFLKVSKNLINALIIQCIGNQYSPTCFDTLKCHHQGVNHDPAEIGAQCSPWLRETADNTERYT
jgi:hypothetical protein